MIHILPSTPGPGGVADYALRVAEGLSWSHEVNLLVVGRNGTPSPKTTPGLLTCDASSSSLLEALTRVSANIAVLHYANYGYAKRGCPFFLVEALNRWKVESTKRRVITIFHEVKSSGPPWRSSFWLSPFQKTIAGDILRLSDTAITSMELYRKILVNLNPQKRDSIHVLPVFSTVGEPEFLPAWSQRQPRMILFGGRGARERVLKKSSAALIRACEALDIVQVLDIGPSLEIPIKLGNLSVESFGELEAREVSALMSNSRAGFFDYPTQFLSKSTILAAYCAHGLLPVTGHQCTETENGLYENTHYWNVSTRLSDTESETIASNALEWYKAHSLQQHVEYFRKLLHLDKTVSPKL